MISCFHSSKMQAYDSCFSAVQVGFIEHDRCNLSMLLLEHDTFDSMMFVEQYIEIVQHLE